MSDEVIRHPFYEYQEELIRLITEDIRRLYAILKSPKLGISQFWILFMLWKCLTDKAWQFGQCMITVATAGDEVQRMLKRCKDILDNPYHPIPYNLGYRTNLNQFTVNNVEVMVLPPNSIDQLRSKTNARLILLDEVAFFNRMIDDSRVQAAAEHYYGSRNYYLVMVSTAPETAGGFFMKLIKDGDPRYHIIRWTNPKKYGLAKHPDSGTSLYDPKYIELQKDTPTFKRNFLGLVGHGAGDIFDSNIIDSISNKSFRIPPRFSYYTSALGVDPAHGHGKRKTAPRFGIVGLYKQGGIYYTGYMKELESPSADEGRDAIHAAMSKGFKTLCIDAADPGLIGEMRKKYHVVPMNFNSLQTGNATEEVVKGEELKYEESLKMIDLVERVTCQKKLVRIHPSHDSLLDQLRAITRNTRLLPDKTQSRFDLGDAYQMALYHLYRYGDGLGIV